MGWAGAVGECTAGVGLQAPQGDRARAASSAIRAATSLAGEFTTDVAEFERLVASGDHAAAERAGARRAPGRPRRYERCRRRAGAAGGDDPRRAAPPTRSARRRSRRRGRLRRARVVGRGGAAGGGLVGSADARPTPPRPAGRGASHVSTRASGPRRGAGSDPGSGVAAARTRGSGRREHGTRRDTAWACWHSHVAASRQALVVRRARERSRRPCRRRQVASSRHARRAGRHRKDDDGAGARSARRAHRGRDLRRAGATRRP